jgi:AraC-like DNA-binding protein
VRYAEFAAPPALAPFVHCLWVFEGEAEPQPQRIAPDGRCELILHWRAPYFEREGEAWRRQPRALFAGQLTRPLHIQARGPAGVAGVRFRTAAARAYMHAPLSAFTDRRVALPERGLVTALSAAGDEAERLELVCDHLATRLRPELLDPAVSSATAAIRAGQGRTPLAELAAEAALSPRALQRRFAAQVGVSPRMLASLVRFRRVFEALQAPDVADWTSAAQAAGYFDHPQMARDFQRFLGCSASAFASGEPGLAASLADL